MTRKLFFATGILLWILSLVLVSRQAEPYTPNTPARPAAATIKITDHKGNVYWTDSINFNETRSCVIFIALPAGTHSVVCGDYRMEGLQGEQKPAAAQSV